MPGRAEVSWLHFFYLSYTPQGNASAFMGSRWLQDQTRAGADRGSISIAIFHGINRNTRVVGVISERNDKNVTGA